MTFLMYTLHVLICFFLIAVVLLQQGKGADLSVFGGGGTQTAFGARGAATVLHKLTVGSFIAFILTTLSIGVLQTRNDESKVLSDLPEAVEETVSEEAEAEPEETGALPTEAPADEPAADDTSADDTSAADASEASADGEPEAAATEGDEEEPAGDEAGS